MAYNIQFKILEMIDNGDFYIYEKLSDEEKKTFSDYMTLRWIASTDDHRQVIFANEFVNSVLFEIGNHPSLMLKLLTCSSSKVRKRYKFKGIKKKGSLDKYTEIIKEYYDYSTKEAKLYKDVISNENIIAMAEELGYQKSDITKLKKQLK